MGVTNSRCTYKASTGVSRVHSCRSRSNSFDKTRHGSGTVRLVGIGLYYQGFLQFFFALGKCHTEEHKSGFCMIRMFNVIFYDCFLKIHIIP